MHDPKPAEKRKLPPLPRLLGLALLFGVALPGCAGRDTPEERLATIDSVLIELGGPPAGVLSRTQRWRMVSSLGQGLPPPGYDAESLPGRESRGAGLLLVYCQACHWLPAPQMHSADEWPLLVRRMLMRSSTLRDRMGGPLTAELVGSELLGRGMTITYDPSPEDADSLIAYLQAHALPAAAPGEIGEGADANFYVRTCGQCHEIPSPAAHTPAEWAQVLDRMSRNMPVMGIAPMAEEERARILAFLEDRGTP